MTESILPAEGEHLTNGWEPDAPPDDTLKRRAVLVHASWPVAVAGALGRPWRRTDRWAGAVLGDGDGALVNPVVLTAPVADADAAEVVAEIEDLVPRSTTYFLLSPWLTPDLAPHGLALLGHPPLMLRLPAPATPRRSPGRRGPGGAGRRGPRGRRAGPRRGLPDAGHAARQRARARPARRPDPRVGGVRRRGARLGRGRAPGRGHDARGVRRRAAGRTGQGRRRRGHLGATLADPGAPAVLVASDDGRPTYESMGYLPLERWTAWLRPESASGPRTGRTVSG